MIWQDKSYEGELIRADSDSLKLILKGENLQIPICYEISHGGYKMTQGEFELSIPFDAAQPQSAAAEIYRSMMLLDRADSKKEGDVLIYHASTAVLKCDKKTEAFLSLDTENGKVTFKEFSFMPKTL